MQHDYALHAEALRVANEDRAEYEAEDKAREEVVPS